MHTFSNSTMVGLKESKKGGERGGRKREGGDEEESKHSSRVW